MAYFIDLSVFSGTVSSEQLKISFNWIILNKFVFTSFIQNY